MNLLFKLSHPRSIVFSIGFHDDVSFGMLQGLLRAYLKLNDMTPEAIVLQPGDCITVQVKDFFKPHKAEALAHRVLRRLACFAKQNQIDRGDFWVVYKFNHQGEQVEPSFSARQRLVKKLKAYLDTLQRLQSRMVAYTDVLIREEQSTCINTLTLKIVACALDAMMDEVLENSADGLTPVL